MEFESLVTVSQAARELGLSEWTIYRWKEAGLIAYYPIGDGEALKRRPGAKKQERFRLKISDVVRYLESRRVAAIWEAV
jgi:predicted site-specific integrase-resolvase